MNEERDYSDNPPQGRAKCETCGVVYNDELVQPHQTSQGTWMQCPICALYTRNKIHGLPVNEPFTGEIAGQMYARAVQSIEGRGLFHPLLDEIRRAGNG